MKGVKEKRNENSHFKLITFPALKSLTLPLRPLSAL